MRANLNQDLDVSMSQQQKRDDSLSDYLDKDMSQADLEAKKKRKEVSPALQALDNPSSTTVRGGNLSVMNK
jgi:hypothetical protein